MKVFHRKQKPNIVTYRNYKHFSNEAFMVDVKNSIIQMTSERNNLEFDRFKTALDKAIQRHAPIKKRYVQANEAPFINKKINKEIMKRSRLRNKFLNTKSDIDRKAYNKQRNLCVSLIRSEKKNFFSNINPSDITDNKTFWKTVKPFFTDKIKTKSKITLIEKKVVSQEGQEEIVSEKIITEDQAVAEVFNKFFINIAPNLKISTHHGYDNDFIATDDQVANAVNKFRNHSSIIMIKNKKKNEQGFSFGPETYDDILKKVNTLDTAKASQQSDISTKILKQNSYYFAEYFYENINQCISKSVFPSDLKLADVTPVYKKKSKNSKDNYRPVSILSNISKIYERCIYDQIQLFFDSVLSKYQCEFRRGYNAQHCLVSLIEKWKKSVDNGGAFGALLTDLSKAFDCLPHELLIAKLDAYGFDKSSLN